MKIILLRDIRGLGNRFDVKDVSDGHAKNFLIPKGLAKIATLKAMQELTHLMDSTKEENTEYKKRLSALQEILRDRHIEFFVKTNKEGKVFGSVTKEMILRALRENKLLTKERVDILLEHPLKELGEYTIAMDLKRGLTAHLKIIISAAKEK